MVSKSLVMVDNRAITTLWTVQPILDTDRLAAGSCWLDRVTACPNVFRAPFRVDQSQLASPDGLLEA